MTDIFVESWGTGTPVVLVHGSLATGADEWQAQCPLAEDGYLLLVLDRRGCGRSPSRAVVKGAGHEIQFTGPPINEALMTLWRRAARSDRLVRSLSA